MKRPHTAILIGTSCLMSSGLSVIPHYINCCAGSPPSWSLFSVWRALSTLTVKASLLRLDIENVTGADQVVECRAGLGQNGFYEQPKFVRYVEYLQYWREPAYTQHIKSVSFSERRLTCMCAKHLNTSTHKIMPPGRRYPHSLHFLGLLQSKAFRDAVKQTANMVWHAGVSLLIRKRGH